MLFLTLLQGALAYAALGGAASDFGTTPVKSARSLAASRTATTSTDTAAVYTAAVYTVSQSTLDSGTIVREYSNSAGTVFAVSWSGPTLPDLRTLLGDKFTDLTAAAASRAKAGHSQLSVQQSDLVIVSNGHMRSYAGHAWIPSALPSGFDTSTIE
jgi:ABC-type proline/glycine betaine transport system substrate-binding protein